MKTVNLLQKYCKSITSKVLYSFKLVLYLDATAIGKQIKYYLTTNKVNFLEMQYGFYRHALLADLLVERAFTNNSRKAET